MKMPMNQAANNVKGNLMMINTNIIVYLESDKVKLLSEKGQKDLQRELEAVKKMNTARTHENKTLNVLLQKKGNHSMYCCIHKKIHHSL